MKNTQTYSIFNSDQQASGNPPATGTPSSFFTQQVPQPSVPKGGGAIKSIDEKFTINAVNGTSGAGIGLPFSPSRNGFAPALSLNYNSGGGNGIFGLGWNLGPGSITRKTDKQLPQYKDAEDSDTFLLSGAEDLVPLLIKDDRGNWTKDCISSGGISINRYRPRIESGFARIEKLTEAGGNVYWKITSGSNATGYIRMTDGSYSQKSLPPVEYTYRQAGWDTTVKTLPAASAENLPTVSMTPTSCWTCLMRAYPE